MRPSFRLAAALGLAIVGAASSLTLVLWALHGFPGLIATRPFEREDRGASFPASDGGPAEAAANLALRGDLDGSDHVLDLELSQHPDNAPALFVHACVNLQRGELDEARQAISRLVALAPAQPEATVLQALVARRAVRPAAPWLPDFLAALATTTGRDLTLRLLSDQPTTRRPIPDEALVSLNSSDRFVVHYAQHEGAVSGDLLHEAESINQTPATFPVSLAALDILLRGSLPQGEQEGAAATAAAMAKRLASEHPDDLFRGVGAILVGTSDGMPFSEAETVALEKALRVGLTFTAFPTIYGSFREVLMKVEPAQAEELAFAAACGPFQFPEYSKMVRRTKRSAAIDDIELRERVGRVAAALAGAIGTQPFLLGAAQARGLMREAATLIPDGQMTTEATKMNERFHELHSTGAGLEFISEFAIPSLRSEIMATQVQDEIGLVERLR
jgi:hypothetical protein